MRDMKKWNFLLAAVTLALSVILTGCGGQQQEEEQVSQTSPEDLHHVKIKVKDYGTISVELDSQAAPLTVENFINLAKDGFYDGLTFHRVIKGFMIQGGDPNGDGTGGSEKTVKGEFSKKGGENPLKHTRGTISMARSSDMDSASSQFFIVQETSAHLDKEYAAFGHVTEGIEIVDKICDDVKTEDSNGSVAPENQPVIESIEVVD